MTPRIHTYHSLAYDKMTNGSTQLANVAKRNDIKTGRLVQYRFPKAGR